MNFVKDHEKTLDIKSMSKVLTNDTIYFGQKLKKTWFLYISIHDASYEILHLIAEKLSGLRDSQDYIFVSEQNLRDSKLPTVSLPYSEERCVLDMAINITEKNGVQVIVTNYLDDRYLSVVVRNMKSRDWNQLSGNDIGYFFH